jgi:hypothetical protein
MMVAATSSMMTMGYSGKPSRGAKHAPTPSTRPSANTVSARLTVEPTPGDREFGCIL